MTKRFMVVGLLIAGIVLAGCSGVTPSVKLGVAHQLPGDSDSTDNEISAWAWTLGGSIKASFPQSGPVIEPCGAVGYTRSVADRDGDISTTGIPAEMCIEIDTAELDS